MTQKSGFWNTEGTTPVGDQLDGYNQIVWSDAASILASCSGFEGVGAGFLNGLEVTTTGLNEVTVDTGGAVVDGKWYKNDAGEAVVIPSAVGGGNTRIDRIVLRCSWAGYTVRIHRIAGTDAGSPTAPAITKTLGTTYDIMLAQVLVDTSGNCVVTDERVFAEPVTVLTDTYYIIALDATVDVEVADDLINFSIIESHSGYASSRLWARLKEASTSGSVVVRFYNVTKAQAIGSVTIAVSETVGFTTTITNPGISVDDLIRIDVTSAGTGALGLQTQMKVVK